MGKRSGAVHVARIVRKYKDREYVSHLLRHTYRDKGKIRHETLGNISSLPDATIELIRQSLGGEEHVLASGGIEILRSRPHGHVAAVSALADKLGLPKLLGSPCRQRTIAMALIISRVCRPASKLATVGWWADTTLTADLGLGDVSTDDVYASMDWLGDRQRPIEKQLAARHLKPAGLVLYDLSSSWMEGDKCSLAARGYSRDGKKGRTQIEYGLLTDEDGRPVSVEVFAGNTADPTAFKSAVEIVRDRFGLTEVTLVGDRGMITNARIEALKTIGGLSWVTALRAPQIRKIADDNGPLQLGLFDETNLAEITHPEFENERLVCCRNPHLAAQRSRKRTELLAATEAELDKIVRATETGRLKDPDKIGIRVGRVIDKHKMAKHFDFAINTGHFAYTRLQDQIAAEAALDGIYVIRTNVDNKTLTSSEVVTTYKRLANVERDFRSLKAIDLDLRPVYHHRENRVRSHVFITMLAAYLTWHLRQAWAPLTYTDEETVTNRVDPVAPAERSTTATHKATHHETEDGTTPRTFGGLLDHLATLTRNTIRVGTTTNTVNILSSPTPAQRKAFDLIKKPIPLTIT